MADLGAIEEDVRFDYAAADTLARLCDAAASVIEGQAGSRASWKNTSLSLRASVSRTPNSTCTPASRLGTSAVGKPRSGKRTTHALCSRSSPMGILNLPARTRTGDDVRVWYRGPLVPHPTTDPPGGRLPLAHVADRFLHYYWAVGTGSSISASACSRGLPIVAEQRMNCGVAP